MLKLKLQTFGHLMWTADSIFPWCWEGLKAEGNKGITDAMDMNLGILWDMVVDRATWRAVVHEVTKSRTQLGNWTTNKEIIEHNTSSLLLVFLLPFNNCHELFFCLCFFYGLLCMCVCVCSATSDSATPLTAASQAPLSVEFSWQEHWRGLPFHIPGDLPNSDIKTACLVSPALEEAFLITVPPEKAYGLQTIHQIEIYTS